MSIDSLYTKAKQAEIRADIRDLQRAGRRYFVLLAEKYQLVEKLEGEVDQYQNGELEEGPTSDVEIAKFFGVNNYPVQTFLNNNMDSGKRNIKARVCLEKGRAKGWSHLRDSGKIPPLEGRVREAAIKAIKKKWGKT